MNTKDPISFKESPWGFFVSGAVEEEIVKTGSDKKYDGLEKNPFCSLSEHFEAFCEALLNFKNSS